MQRYACICVCALLYYGFRTNPSASFQHGFWSRIDQSIPDKSDTFSDRQAVWICERGALILLCETGPFEVQKFWSTTSHAANNHKSRGHSRLRTANLTVSEVDPLWVKAFTFQAEDQRKREKPNHCTILVSLQTLQSLWFHTRFVDSLGKRFIANCGMWRPWRETHSGVTCWELESLLGRVLWIWLYWMTL